MIIKSFDLNGIKKSTSNFFLLYGNNEGHIYEIINSCFFKDFRGEVIKYDETEILENKENFYEICLNESLFEKEKIIQISRITSKSYELINYLAQKNINDKKIILIASALDKK